MINSLYIPHFESKGPTNDFNLLNSPDIISPFRLKPLELKPLDFDFKSKPFNTEKLFPKLKLLSKVGFFTPVQYGKEAAKEHGFRAKAVEFFDDYFFLGGKHAFIDKAVSKTKGEGVIWDILKPKWYMIALKVISYATLIVPAIMLIGKAIARFKMQYRAIDLLKPVHVPKTVDLPKPVNDSKSLDQRISGVAGAKLPRK